MTQMSLSWEDDLRAYLAPAGPIAEVRMALDYDGRPKGFCHVQFETLEGAAGAIALTGGDLSGREVHIETTTERAPRELSIVVDWSCSTSPVCFFLPKLPSRCFACL